MQRHDLLAGCGVWHGFGTRTSPEPTGLLRPRQVHGATIVAAAACRAAELPEADGVVSREPGVPVGIVTADCVPILLASEDGTAVAAVHAGWRGLARGVVVAGVDALRQESPRGVLVAVVGPHIGSCCYEVDTPVVEALSAGLGPLPEGSLREGREGHVWLDLGAVARHALEQAGLPSALLGGLPGACTSCQVERYHSYRRDGSSSGRLVHFIAAAEA